MKRRLVVEVDGDVVTVEGGGDDLDDKAKANLLLLAAKKLRLTEGVLQLSVFKDLATQAVGLDFQKDEIKDWSEALGMLDQAKRTCEFQQWFNMFMSAQQAVAMQAQAAMQDQAIKQAVSGNGRIFKGR